MNPGKKNFKSFKKNPVFTSWSLHSAFSPWQNATTSQAMI